MKQLICLLCLLLVFAAVQRPLSVFMAAKPAAEKVGFIANPQLMRLVSGDQGALVAAFLSFKSLYYYGNLVEEMNRNQSIPVDYHGLYRLLAAATVLNPYNVDPYYFSQAILVWEVGYVKEVVALLTHGMQYRTWDWMLPFWAGFDSANFLLDFDAAAKFYQQAAVLSGADTFSRLASRYLYESDQTAYAIRYLEAMLKTARNPAIRKSFEERLDALHKIKLLEVAVAAFSAREGRSPESLQDLLVSGDLLLMPDEPFGGSYFLDENGKPRSTTLFSVPKKVK